jgi:hypothetical protein
MDQTFHSSWVQQVQKTDQSERVLEEQVLGWLRARYGEDYLKHTRHTTIAELQEDVRSNRLCWPARYAVMRHCQYESAAARTYWRRLELFDITPLTYDRFLRHARGTMVIRMEPLKFETILKGTMNLGPTDPRDKIYGMLGLVSHKARKVIPISSSKPPEWTFVPTMAYIIRHEPDGLALLGLLWARRPEQSISVLGG